MSEQSKGPPPDISPSELWAAITSTPVPHRVVDFPRKDPITGQPIGTLAIIVLKQQESMACVSAADAFAKRNIKELAKKDEENRGYHDLFNNEAAIQILVRACRDSKRIDQQVFKSATDLRSQLTDDEVAVLFKLYMQVRAELGPIVAEMSPEEMDAWIERLAIGGGTFPLAQLSQDALEVLAIFMARRIQSLQTDKSSPGSPPEESPTDLTLPSDA